MSSSFPENLPRSLTGPFFESGLLRLVDDADGKLIIQSAITGMTYPATLDRTTLCFSTSGKNGNR
jgi:hypothetical protein